MTQPVANDCTASGPTGLFRPVLVEISDLLETFSDTGQGGAIDLRSVPMSDADRAGLETFLGRGEVSVTLDIAGKSEIWETGYSGVWWIRHIGGDGRIAAEIIEVTAIPQIIKSDASDAGVAAQRLAQDISDSAIVTPNQIDQPTEELNG